MIIKITKSMNKLQAKFKTNGLGGVLISLIKRIMQFGGIKYNRYYYITNDIDKDELFSFYNSKPISDIKELTMEDFLLYKNDFSERKIDTISKRFQSKTYRAYGIIRDKRLVYYCWISLEEFRTSCKDIKGTLQENEFLLIDAFCHPTYRGQGLHGTMNAYRLLQGYKLGYTKSVGIVLKENKPALRSQIKVGFKVEFIYYVCNIWGKTYTNFYKLKRRCK